MLFNTIEFALFLPLVFICFWSIKRYGLKAQNTLLLVASYIFYGWWDWRFLSLILFSTVIDYYASIGMSKYESRKIRKMLVCLSILVNVGFLGFFKYHEFFVENFVAAFSLLGHKLNVETLDIILPVGISFYTFQTLSYSLDVYKRKMPATTDFISFAAFVSFFPQLVAGPIERAAHLLPQFHTSRIFDYTKAVDGLKQVLQGLFKKVIIADYCAVYANEIFDNSSHYSGSTLLFGALFFSFQIYGDFSGYSDIAIGSARLFGFDLMRNFSNPYFSRDIAEFWRRWHISLSTWFRDYVYIPLGGSKVTTGKKIRNVFIIFLLSGFWHGPKWTFVVWGALHALYFLPSMISGKNRNNLNIVAYGKIMPSLQDFLYIVRTFTMVTFAWIFFRANKLEHAFSYIHEIFSPSLFSIPFFKGRFDSLFTIGAIIAFMMIEWVGREQEYALSRFGSGWPKIVRWCMYYAIILIIFLYAAPSQQFIYFQF